MRRLFLSVLSCAVLVLVGVAGPASAANAGTVHHRQPFLGYAVGTAAFPEVSTTVCPPTAVFVGGRQTQTSATGAAYPLGRVAVSAAHCTPLVDQVRGGTMSLTTARGGVLRVAYSGVCPFDPTTAVVGKTVIHCTSTMTVTGGTGRFAHATGSARLTTLVTFEGFAVPAWPATLSWHGWIALRR